MTPNPSDGTPSVDGAPPSVDGAEERPFEELGLPADLAGALTALGYEEPTPIQREAIPPMLSGHDLLGQAATGTGKTAAFALPLLERLRAPRGPEGGEGPRALVLVPTRELAMQVSEAIHRYGRVVGARVLPVFGGQPFGRQVQALRRGVDVVVATPGRALDHIGKGTLPLGGLAIVVLDEADEMLDMGFAEDIESILEATPPDRQTVLFSATMPSRIEGIARRHLRDPVRIEIERSRVEAGEAPQVRQVAYVVARAHKAAALGRVLDVEAPVATIVFCRTRNEVDELTETLNGRGYRAEALHGGMSQEQRDRVMGRLRSRTAELLVATDVAARGLDIEQLTHVVNYDVPSAPEAYVHRIGRVGRAGREGVAITLAEPREHRLLKNIERLTRQKIPIEKLPSVADLRNRRMELTLATLREVLLDGDLDHYRVVVETLADEFDVVEVALAAVKLVHDADGAPDEEEEIPDIGIRPDRPRADRSRPDRSRPDRARGDRPERGAPRPGGDRGARESQVSSPGTVRLYVAAGRNDGVRPQDLVGAIAGESHLSGRDIGAIEISDKFSLVEVPEAEADAVVDAMRGALIKGRRATIRRERYERR